MNKVGPAQNIVWNYVGVIFDGAVGIALVAYVVRHVGIADYGLFLLANSASGFLMLLDLGLASLLVQAYIGRNPAVVRTQSVAYSAPHSSRWPYWGHWGLFSSSP